MAKFNPGDYIGDHKDNIGRLISDVDEENEKYLVIYLMPGTLEIRQQYSFHYRVLDHLDKFEKSSNGVWKKTT